MVRHEKAPNCKERGCVNNHVIFIKYHLMQNFLLPFLLNIAIKDIRRIGRELIL